MMVRDRLIVVRKPHSMVAMGQTISRARSRRKSDRCRRRDERKDSKRSHRNRDAEAVASSEPCQHAETLAVFSYPPRV